MIPFFHRFYPLVNRFMWKIFNLIVTSFFKKVLSRKCKKYNMETVNPTTPTTINVFPPPSCPLPDWIILGFPKSIEELFGKRRNRHYILELNLFNFKKPLACFDERGRLGVRGLPDGNVQRRTWPRGNASTTTHIAINVFPPLSCPLPDWKTVARSARRARITRREFTKM
jgi:hypothetical protein